MPPEHLVRVIHALIEGLVLQRILTPELFPDEVFFAAFEALAYERGNTADFTRRHERVESRHDGRTLKPGDPAARKPGGRG
jgi:hypothetical protein